MSSWRTRTILQFVGRLTSCSILGLAMLAVLRPMGALAIEPGTKAPDFTLSHVISKENITLSSLKGRVVYLDFWATWCTTCKLSIPWLEELQKAHSAEQLQIVAISVDKDRDKVLSFLKDAKVSSLLTLADPEGNSAELYDLSSFPTSVLINQRGEVVRVFKGFKEAHKEELKNELEKLL